MLDSLRRLALAALATAVLAPDSALGLPLISEVFYDAAGSDDGLGFVEIHGAPGTSLAGLVIEGVNGADGAVTVSIALAGSIPGDGLFVLADRLADGTTLVAGADLLADFDFQNGPDSIVLRGPAGPLDAVGYGVFGAGTVFAGEGQPASDPPAGSSLARPFADVDSNDNALDFAALASPTPGAAAFLSVPEPAPFLLGLAGLASLAAASAAPPRRR